MADCSCPSGSIQVGGWCIGGAGSIAVPCSPGGTQQPISPAQVAVPGIQSGIIAGILAPLEQAITSAVPRIGLFVFGIILFIVGFLLLKG